MNRVIVVGTWTGLVLACGVLVSGKYYRDKHTRQLQAQQQAWAEERAQLAAALDRAKADATRIKVPTTPIFAAEAGERRLSPTEIIEELRKAGGSGATPAARLREKVYWLEELGRWGAAALPAMSEFLLRNEEVEYDVTWFQGREARDGKLPPELVAPISLRFGLFELAKRIGGEQSEALLGQLLGGTWRGLETAWLTYALQQMTPNKYRDLAVASARNLLANGAAPNSSSALDRYHREYLFGVLAFYGDGSYATQARDQLVRAEGQVDRGALKYLQQTLGREAVAVVSQAYSNPALATNAAAKEPLARLALSYVGADTAANQFWMQTINDPVLTKDHRRNLIEDLNQDGFANGKNLAASDLPLIEARLKLIEELAPNAIDQVNAAAFAEAYKDLINMRTKITGQSPAGRP